MKLVTVIIAARNAGRWILPCLASVAAQETPHDWCLRIMLGVDACPETLVAASQAQLPDLTIRYFPEHVGPYVIFNSLAYLEPFHVLVRFDADDVMLGSYLLSQLDLLGSATTPMITQTWSSYVDSQLRPTRAELASGRMTEKDGRRASPSDGQFLMTQAAWRRLGSFQAWWCTGDSEFLCRARWAGIHRKTIPEHLYLRRIHPSALTQCADTGYRSGMRNYYVRLIAQAAERYAVGAPAECIWPMIARSLPGETALRTFGLRRRGFGL